MCRKSHYDQYFVSGCLKLVPKSPRIFWGPKLQLSWEDEPSKETKGQMQSLSEVIFLEHAEKRCAKHWPNQEAADSLNTNNDISSSTAALIIPSYHNALLFKGSFKFTDTNSSADQANAERQSQLVCGILLLIPLRPFPQCQYLILIVLFWRKLMLKTVTGL